MASVDIITYSTDALGADLSPQPWLKYQPSVTNYVVNSETCHGSVSGSSKVSTTDTNDVFGGLNAYKMTEDTTTGVHGIYPFFAAISGDAVLSVYAKAGGGAHGNCVDIHAWGNSDPPSTESAIYDLVNGTVFGPCAQYGDIEELPNGWYLCRYWFGNGVATPQLRIQNSDGANQQYTGDGSSFIYISHPSIYQKTRQSSRGLGPIVTSGASASTDATVINFDEDINDVEGALYCEIQFSFDDAEVSGNHEILSTTTGASLLYYDSDAQQIESTDGTNTAAKSLTVAKNTTYKLGLIWDGTGLQVCVDGEWGTATPYDGSFTGTSLLAFRGLDYCAKIRAVKVWDKGGSLGKSAVDSAMGA